ncbi:TrkH family potassium uptake protein [Clostridium vitabionis]|uniref:TrkH family potassium uptake protein n=1 Tax=Clostridium vitabionis TaxID=2784388 RepID=UPI00188B6777|nr:TrkH family potassium uptake protein [Clostridium vitabionis]
MNFAMISHILGWVLNVEAAFMLLPCLTAVVYGESAGFCFLATMAACLVLGFLLTRVPIRSRVFFTAESMAACSLSWLMMSVMGAVPFVLCGSIPNPVDALFETVSGFTTTGASILPEVESLPRCILFWRSFTHWLGGMGVLVFILSLLPLAGGSHMNLMKAESPGPSVSRMLPKVQTTAKVLYEIYLFMTVVQIAVMLIGGMPVFDALTITFGSAGTGGFAVRNDSMGSYSPFLQTATATFCILFGVNFNFYFLILMRDFRSALKSEEVRTYLAIIAASVLLIALNVTGFYGSFGEALHQAYFQVASIITTTGYGTTDFDLWPSFSKAILVALMFIGACAGSTGGGIKVSRVVLLFRNIRKELQLYLHPNAVCRVKMDGKTVEESTTRSINVFLAVYIIIFGISVLLVALDNDDLVTAFTAVAATFNNIGPGLAMVGPTCNYGFLSPLAKIVLIFDMLAGRLEIFPLLMLFYPKTWQKT